MLHGHERAITQIKYNREGDLLFSSAKDKEPNVWYSLNGERLGTFIGHEGAVWSIDVNWDTTKFMSGAADNKLLLWDVKTGKSIGKISTNSAVRCCQFSYSGNLACYSTTTQGGHLCELFVIDVRTSDIFEGNSILRMTFDEAKITSLLWGSVDETIITGHDNGELQQWDMKVNIICVIILIVKYFIMVLLLRKINHHLQYIFSERKENCIDERSFWNDKRHANE